MSFENRHEISRRVACRGSIEGRGPDILGNPAEPQTPQVAATQPGNAANGAIFSAAALGLPRLQRRDRHAAVA
jgi:hypothetical protein